LGGYWQIIDGTEIPLSLLETEDRLDSFIVQTNAFGFVNVGFYDSVCATLDSTSILFEGIPDGRLIDSVICLKDRPLTLSVRPDRSGDYTYRWSTGEIDTSISVMDSGLFTINLTNECGTRTLETNVRYIDCEVFAPNIITPNGDGLNDYFDLRAYAYYDDIGVFIYNRWGALLYEGQGVNARWDGHLPNGELVSPGTYFYLIEADAERVKGAVTVMYD